MWELVAGAARCSLRSATWRTRPGEPPRSAASSWHSACTRRTRRQPDDSAAG